MVNYLITYIDGATSEIKADAFELSENFIKFYDIVSVSGSNTKYPWVATIQTPQMRTIEHQKPNQGLIMKKQLITALLLTFTQTAFSADLEYVGGNRHQCKGSDCALFDSIQNPNTTQPKPYRQSESHRFAREYKASEQPISQESQKIMDDFWDKAHGIDNEAIIKKANEIQTARELELRTIENNAALESAKKTKND